MQFAFGYCRTSGFRVIRAIPTLFIVKLKSSEFSLIRTNTQILSELVKGCRAPNWSISVSQYSY